MSFSARGMVRSVKPRGLLAVEIVELNESCRNRLLAILDEVHAPDA